LLAAKGFTRAQRDLGEDIVTQRSALGVLEIVAAKSSQLDHVSVATALNRIAKCPDGLQAAGGSDFAALADWLPEFDARSLSNSVWAYATLSFFNMPLLHALAAKAINTISD